MSLPLQDQIVLFGDSITQASHRISSSFSFDPASNGWGAALAHEYQRKLDVVNRGYSGYNTDWALPLLASILPLSGQVQASIALFCIFFGANDAALECSVQHVPVDRYMANIKKMMDTILDAASPRYSATSKVLLFTPPPLDDEGWSKKCKEDGIPVNRRNSVTATYADAIRQVQHPRVVIVDVWTEFMTRAGLLNGVVPAGQDKNPLASMEQCPADAPALGDFFVDGLHFSPLGCQATELIMRTISQHIPELSPENIQENVPSWRDVAQSK
ncbi:hypothetical protein BZG36_04988 [Bifiguratus adelaidae]|uniref:SGNH hydrolase-type esterase domain-containing protein n=1 Tax=Bifiguratus adelaidae TaxID=1938954 RepID=A0A261XUG8_9FUNG|nr:hypothetical protein BZG36_04988 [Bifiguratus adelaidae]